MVGSRLNCWKTKPILDYGRWQVRLVQPRDVFARQVVLARGRHVEASEDVHQGRFSRPRRSHDGDVLAPFDRQRDPRSAATASDPVR